MVKYCVVVAVVGKQRRYCDMTLNSGFSIYTTEGI